MSDTEVHSLSDHTWRYSIHHVVSPHNPRHTIYCPLALLRNNDLKPSSEIFNSAILQSIYLTQSTDK